MKNTVIIGKRKAAPSKIICIGRNYAEHISELGNDIPDDMVIFMKPNSSISETLKAVFSEPDYTEALNYEAEISFIYENGTFSAAGFGLDLTMRKLQSSLKSKGLPWERAKAFDCAAVFSDFAEISSADGLSIELEINNQLVQKGDISMMIYKPDAVLKEVRRYFTLYDGDIVMTGTPKGVGIIRCGDIFKGALKKDGRIIAEGQWKAE